MPIEYMTIILVCLLTFLMLSGVWTAVALGLSGSVLIYLTKGEIGLRAIGSILYNSTNSYILVAIPLFLFMGEIMSRSGASTHFYRGVAILLRSLPGGLLHANIFACAIFSAVSGSSVATAASVGTAAIPEMRKRGYDTRSVYGSLAAGGTLGILIPPSLLMVLYGDLVNVSVARLFMAGILPGLLFAGLFAAYIGARCVADPTLAPRNPEEMSDRSWADALHVLPVVMVLLVVLGGIYTGITTPTEAAAIGVLGALLLAGGYGGLTLHVFSLALDSTVRLTCMISAIVVGAKILSVAITYIGIGREISQLMVDMNISKWEFLLVVVIWYIILGMFVDGISMIYMTIPILLPTMQVFGFDLIWLGIILTVLVEIGQITPPVGINLFTIHAIARGEFADVVKGSAPFVAIMLAGVLMLIVWPQIALWLPSSLGD